MVYYTLSVDVRLFNPHFYFHQNRRGSIRFSHEACKLVLNDDTTLNLTIIQSIAYQL